MLILMRIPSPHRILMLSSAHFTQLNGMSNRYWGWGLEDDEFRARLRDANLPISRPDVKAVGTGRGSLLIFVFIF